MKKNVITLCSGYDSQCMALDELKKLHPDFDYELIAWAEFDPESKQPIDNQPAVIAHKALYPQWADRNVGDMTKVDWTKFIGTPIDLLVYSTPCFPAYTKVLTDKGEKYIYEVEIGDMVLTHTNSYKKVVKLYKHIHCQRLVELKNSNGNKVVCTPNHPFYMGDDKWVEAENLIQMDCPYTIDGAFPLWSIQTLMKTNATMVYNLEVEDDHSYTANGFIVHNCTDISNAGLQKGLQEGSETRSSILWYTRNAIKVLHPKFLLLENVKALVGKKFKPDFDKWLDELRKMGYESYWRVCNGTEVNVPQNRERVFVVSVRQDSFDEPHYKFPQPVKLTKCIEDILEDDVDEKYYLKYEQVEKFCELIQNEE